MDTATAERSWTDNYWHSPDGLRLHFRDYPACNAAANDRPPIICMHGLTRNARDFSVLADKISKDWRVLALEMRGRGDSEYGRDSATYNPLTYVADVQALLEQEAIERFVAIGTSLGGLMTMLLAGALLSLAGVVRLSTSICAISGVTYLRPCATVRTACTSSCGSPPLLT